MSSVKRIHKRRTKKILGYFLISGGTFCLVFSVCVGVYLIRHKDPVLMSPLSTLGKIVFNNSDNLIASQIDSWCHKYSLQCQNISVKDYGEADFTIDDHLIVISTNKNIEQEIASLQLTIRALTMEGKGYRGLDFRYDRPVISY